MTNDSSTRTVVRAILGAYHNEGIEAQADEITGFIENLVRSRDELEKRFYEEAEERWIARLDAMERIYRCVTINVNAAATKEPEGGST